MAQGRHGFQGCGLPPPRGPHPGASSPMVHGQFCLPQQRHITATPGVQSASLALHLPAGSNPATSSLVQVHQEASVNTWEALRTDLPVMILSRAFYTESHHCHPPAPFGSSNANCVRTWTADAVWRVTGFYPGRGTDMVFN